MHTVSRTLHVGNRTVKIVIMPTKQEMATTKVMLSYPWIGSNNSSKASCNDAGSLSDAVVNVARAELRENNSTREQSLEQLRDWVKKNKDIQDVRTDEIFLLRFLRTKKFSVPLAQQTLLKYLNLKNVFPQFFTKLDYLSPGVNDIISNGYIYASPIRDENGRRVIITDLNKFDPHKYTSADMARAHMITYETLMEEPENQVLGFTHIGDLGGITAAHITCWPPAEFVKTVRWGEQSVPMRHKQIHIINAPAAMKYLFDMVLSIVSKKIQDRVHIHSTLKDMHLSLDPGSLPLEYGGKIPASEMISSWIQELSLRREKVLSLDAMRLLNDRGITKKYNDSNNNLADGGSLSGSFRKLEVD